MKKKIFVLFLCCLIALSALACGKKAPDAAGTWKAKTISGMGMDLDIEAFGEQMGVSDMKMELELKEDGTAVFDSGEETEEGSWKLEGNAFTLAVGDEAMTGTLEDGKLTLEEDGMSIVFEK